MRAFVLHAHPDPESFSTSLRSTVCSSLEQNGWEIDLCDLYEENFNPVLSREERQGYHSIPENRKPVQHYIDRIQSADGIFFVYPVWIFGFPAIMKGFLDRVMVPGVAFDIIDGKLKPVKSITKYVVCVATYGGPRIRALMTLDPPRMIANSNFRFYFTPKVFKYLALYDMNNVTEDKLKQFLNRVKIAIGTLK